MKNIVCFLIITLSLSGMAIQKSTAQEIIVDTDMGIYAYQIKKDLNGDVIIGAITMDTNSFERGVIIKVTQDFDTVYRSIDDTLNKVSIYDLLVTSDNNYIISAVERLPNDTCYGALDHYSFFVYDADLNLISFRRYLSPDPCTSTPIKLVQRMDGRIFGIGVNPGIFYLLEINELGDTLQTFLSTADSLKGMHSGRLAAHKDSLALYDFFDKFYQSNTIWRVITVDTALNFSISPIIYSDTLWAYPRSIVPTWLNDSIYMVAAAHAYSKDKFNVEDIIVYKANANQNHQDMGVFAHFYRPDTTDLAVSNTPTYTDYNNIYIGSSNGSIPWAPWDGRYMVGVVDVELNIKGMKSIGKEGFLYDLGAMQATDDGGCIAIGTVHDNTNAPDWDYDLFIRKFMPDDIITSAAETPDPYDSDFAIYPNPGNMQITIQTSPGRIQAEIFTPNGQMVLSKRFNSDEIKKLNTERLSPGVYFIQITGSKGYSEIIKWIKVKMDY